MTKYEIVASGLDRARCPIFFSCQEHLKKRFLSKLHLSSGKSALLEGEGQISCFLLVRQAALVASQRNGSVLTYCAAVRSESPSKP